MSQFNTSGTKGWINDTKIGRGRIVKLSSGKVVVATAGTDKSVGVVETEADDGRVAGVRLRSAQGTLLVKAGGNIAVGDAVTATTAGAGIATTTAGDHVVGYALETGVSGDLVELSATNSKY